jgi:hypothetical protein
MVAALSGMLFDSPGSTGSMATKLIFTAIWLHPIGAISGSILTFSNRKRRQAPRYFLAIVLCLAPLAMAAAALTIVELACAGRLAR